MLQKGTAKKVTIFINEDTQHHFGSLSDSILTFLLHKGVSGATATRAMAGFGAHQVMHTTKIEVLAEHLPIRIEFIESAQKVDELMPALYDLVTDGVIQVQDTQIVKVANKERPAPPEGPRVEMRGTAKMIKKDQPIVVTIVDTPENVERLIPEVEEMMGTGMIATSDVEYIRIQNPPLSQT